MRQRLAGWLLLLMLMAVFVAPAHAQISCGTRDKLAATLLSTHREVPVSRGLTADGHMIEIFAFEHGSWTAVVTRPTKVSCIVAAGEYWSNLPRPTEFNYGPAF